MKNDNQMGIMKNKLNHRQKKTQKQTVLELLNKMPVVTNEDFHRAGISHVARNRVSELTKDGHTIAHYGYSGGKDWSRNCYMLLASNYKTPDINILNALVANGWEVRP